MLLLDLHCICLNNLVKKTKFYIEINKMDINNTLKRISYRLAQKVYILPD